MAKKYKCPYCEKRLIRKDLITHIDKSHKELIPENYTAARLVYNQVNKVDHGKCRVCGKPTTWSEKSGRYEVLCGDPKCKEHMREEYKKNMLRVRGTYNILNDPEQQKKMLANRSISGQYKFQDGGILTYTGSYEKKCLEFMDVVMQIPSKDILSPGPTLEYEYNGEKHFYITDFYYIPYNLIIEVKDGGDNLNTKDSASMKASREKTIEKEHLITDRGEYNYIRLTNNNFAQLIEVFMIIKEKLLEGDDSKTYRINESQVVLEDYFDETGRSSKFIRITYDGEGIYQAFKESVSFDVWKSFKNSNAANWLPLPPSYEGNYRSYFTTTGYKMFMKRTYPVMVKYLDKSKIKIEEVYLQQSNIVYEDKFQVVVAEDSTISDIRNAVNKIHQKYLKDNKPPTGNQNCQLCTWCVEAWFRGISVLPRPIYSPTDIAFEFNGYDIVKNPELIKFRSKEDFKRIIHSSGNGSRYYVHVKWNGGSGGHEFMAVSIDNIIYIIDAQQGLMENMDTSYVVKDYFNINYNESYMVRLDNKQFNRELLKYNDNKYIKELTEDDMKMLEESAVNESCELSSSNTGIINPQWKIFADYMCTKYKVNNSIKINIKFLHSKASFDTMSKKYNDDASTNVTIRDRNTIYVLDEDIYNNLYHDNYNNIVRYEIAQIILSKYYNANTDRTIEAICVYESGMLDEFEAYNTGKIKRAKKYKEYLDANGIAAVMRYLTSNKAIIN